MLCMECRKCLISNSNLNITSLINLTTSFLTLWNFRLTAKSLPWADFRLTAKSNDVVSRRPPHDKYQFCHEPYFFAVSFRHSRWQNGILKLTKGSRQKTHVTTNVDFPVVTLGAWRWSRLTSAEASAGRGRRAWGYGPSGKQGGWHLSNWGIELGHLRYRWMWG
jgi:hypothetical protein